ncbi:MAG: hypothetical protein K9M81_03900 [Chthoniobacterales bacterium]|nr:hypothetical protein [Chthoniobacterales bacterium]
MDTASASNCSSGSMKHTAVVAIHHLRCLATNQYEICGLTLHGLKIFFFLNRSPLPMTSF